LETPSDLNQVSSFLNLRVADIWACYKQWGDQGAFFLTEPLNNHGWSPSTGSTTTVSQAI
ncbi:MAG: hypothetical protein WAK62_10185, partial [Terriglobales bacterium]